MRGNILECEGLTELLRPVIALCDSEGQPPSSLTKLYLQDNCIDSHGAHGGTFAPIISMRAMKRYMTTILEGSVDVLKQLLQVGGEESCYRGG